MFPLSAILRYRKWGTSAPAAAMADAFVLPDALAAATNRNVYAAGLRPTACPGC